MENAIGIKRRMFEKKSSHSMSMPRHRCNNNSRYRQKNERRKKNLTTKVPDRCEHLFSSRDENKCSNRSGSFFFWKSVLKWATFSETLQIQQSTDIPKNILGKGLSRILGKKYLWSRILGKCPRTSKKSLKRGQELMGKVQEIVKN